LSIEDLREQKRKEFINEAWEDIRAAMFLGRQKIKLATITLNSALNNLPPSKG